MGAVLASEDSKRRETYQRQISDISARLKEKEEDLVLIHNMDRGFDDPDYFRLIDKDLADKFVIRLKLNCHSGLEKWNSGQGKEVNHKLKEVDFLAHSE